MSGEVTKGLEVTRERLDRWRREQGGKGRWIPEELWKEAVDAAQSNGIESTARALRLNVDRLRERMSRSEARGAVRSEPETVFVEMGALCNWRSVMECLGRDGQRLRIEITGPGPVDAAGVCRAFFGGGQ